MFAKITLLSCLSMCAIGSPTIAPPGHTAARARYTVHAANWAAVSTFSTMDKIKGYPYVSVIAMSDGTIDNSTGVAYLYLTKYDPASSDLAADNRCTLGITLAETDYCKNANFDPMDPRCVRVMITGNFMKIDPESEEHATGFAAMLARHPSIVHWPKNHDFYLAKVEIMKISVLDYFGGVHDVSVEDYFNANI